MAEATVLVTAPPNRQPRPLLRSHIPTDFDVLAACCAASFDPSTHAHFLHLANSVADWARLLNAAEYHGLIPLLFAQTSNSIALGSEKLNQLRLRYQENTRRALWFTCELTRILEHLENAGVRAIAHKGPALAFTLYGDVTQRQFRDLDLLVQVEDVGKTRSELARLGYECGLNLSPREERDYLTSGYEYVFHSPYGRNLLEVQWAILPRFYSVDFNIAKMFERSRDIQVDAARWKTLSPADLFLVLSAHAAKHMWTQLSWLRDITQLATTADLDWEFVYRQAGYLGMQKIVHLTLALASRIFGTRLPFAPPQSMHIESTAEEILDIVRRGTPYKAESLSYFRWMMRLRERRRDRIRFAWRLAATPGPREWMSAQLPAPLFPLYRIIRLGRLLARIPAAINF